MSIQLRLLLTAALFAVCGAKLAQCAQSPLTITISPANGATEKIGSPVAMSVTLTNHSDRTLSSSQWDYADRYLIDVRDAQGNPVPESEEARKKRADIDACKNSGKAVCGRQTGGHGLMSQIAPGESWQERLLITQYFDMSRAGKYTIQLERQLPEELGKGSVKSNPITVTVTE